MDTLFERLRTTANETMKATGLTDDYIKSINYVWNVLERWLAENGIDYSPDAGNRFLRECYGINEKNRTKLNPMNRRRQRAVTILCNCYEHKPYFRIEERRYEQRFAPGHEQLLVAFLDEQLRYNSESTRCQYVYALNRFSRFLDGAGIYDLGDLRAGDIVAFFEMLGKTDLSQATIYGHTSRVRALLGWLASKGVCDEALKDCVPRAKTPQRRLPDTYSPDEITSMVSTIDTKSAVGKRNRIVCLLAARLGMRASDITALEFSHLDWKNNAISFATVKSGVMTTLPLTSEIGTAIIDYLRNGRPDSDCPYVLIRHVAPYVKMRSSTVHTIVANALNRAGIDCAGRRRGPHALRASMATNMMRENVAIPVISQTLSHRSSETTMVYLKVDLSKLRECALEVPELPTLWWRGWR